MTEYLIPKDSNQAVEFLGIVAAVTACLALITNHLTFKRSLKKENKSEYDNTRR